MIPLALFILISSAPILTALAGAIAERHDAYGSPTDHAT